MTGRGAREFTWMEDGVRPSLGFGHWHTHGTSLAEGADVSAEADWIVDQMEGIMTDIVVLLHPVDGPCEGYCEPVDLRDPDVLAEELARPDTGRVRLVTWSGRGDREIGPEDPVGA